MTFCSRHFSWRHVNEDIMSSIFHLFLFTLFPRKIRLGRELDSIWFFVIGPTPIGCWGRTELGSIAAIVNPVLTIWRSTQRLTKRDDMVTITVLTVRWKCWAVSSTKTRLMLRLMLGGFGFREVSAWNWVCCLWPLTSSTSMKAWRQNGSWLWDEWTSQQQKKIWYRKDLKSWENRSSDGFVSLHPH